MSDKRVWKAVILFAHGGRDERWRVPLDVLAEKVRALAPPERVELAFLEFAEPSLDAVVEELLRAGPDSPGGAVLIIPVFFSGGGHVAGDLPGLLDRLRTRFPRVRFDVTGALGEEPEVLSAMADVAARIVSSGPPGPGGLRE